MTSTRAPCCSTDCRTRYASSPGCICAGSIWCTLIRPRSTIGCSGIPSAAERLKRLDRLSSKMNIATLSPRSAAATAYCVDSADFPQPAGPMMSVLVPRSTPPPRRAVKRGVALQLDDAVRHALELHVVHLGGAVVEEEHGDVPPGEELLQRQDLLAIAQRALREQPDLRQRVEHDAVGLEPFDLGEHGPDRLPKLDLGRIEDRRLFLLEAVLADELLVNVNGADVPVMRPRHGAQLVARLGQRDVHRRLAVSHAFEQKLQAERGLADTRIALQKVNVIARKTAEENVIQTFNAGRRNCFAFHDFALRNQQSSECVKSRFPANCGDR